jgi:hypothetical protein
MKSTFRLGASAECDLPASAVDSIATAVERIKSVRGRSRAVRSRRPVIVVLTA